MCVMCISSGGIMGMLYVQHWQCVVLLLIVCYYAGTIWTVFSFKDEREGEVRIEKTCNCHFYVSFDFCLINLSD